MSTPIWLRKSKAKRHCAHCAAVSRIVYSLSVVEDSLGFNELVKETGLARGTLNKYLAELRRRTVLIVVPEFNEKDCLVYRLNHQYFRPVAKSMSKRSWLKSPSDSLRTRRGRLLRTVLLDYIQTSQKYNIKPPKSKKEKKERKLGALWEDKPVFNIQAK